MRLLALTSEKRSAAFPDTPTMDEAGVPGVVSMAWFGIHAPKAVPRNIVIRLHGDAVKSLHDPTIRQRFETDGAEVVGSTPEQFAKFVVNEIAKWTRVVKQAGIKFE